MAKWTEWDMWKAEGALNSLADLCHTVSKLNGFYEGFEEDLESDPYKGYIIPVKIALIMTELGEAIEGHRAEDYDNFREEMADVFIRLLDLTGALGIDIEAEIQEKMQTNLKRPYKHGKKY